MLLTCFPHSLEKSSLDLLTLLFSFLTAIGTIGVVIVALFHESLDNYFRKAKITVKLADPDGDSTSGIATSGIGSLSTNVLIGSSGIQGISLPPRSYGTSSFAPTPGPLGIHGIATSIGSFKTSGYAVSPQISDDVKLSVTYFHLKVIRDKKHRKVKECRVSLVGISKKVQGEGDKFNNLKLIVCPYYSWAPAEIQPQAIDIITEGILDLGYFIYDRKYFHPAVWPTFNNFEGDLNPKETIRYEIEIVAENIIPQRYFIEVSWDGTFDSNLHKATNFVIQEPILVLKKTL
jgi:hypothetical protein